MTAQLLTKPISLGDRYVLRELLAVGGMAEIYLAKQNAMAGFEKEVVVKRLKPELAEDPKIVEMFLDEARIGAVLNNPNIVHVYDVEEYDGVPYIVMEYIRGEELNVLCRRGLGLGQFLPLEHAVELMRQAAAGMGYFHARRGDDGDSRGIVHCDISPTNLLVTEDGFLKLIDFGIARARGQRFRDENSVPGKLSYMSPEQAGRKSVDHRSDIFSLGVVLYEITVGKRLFKGPAQEVVRRLLEAEIEPPTFVRHKFPGQLESVVMRALELHPGDRYQSAYDLADDLEAFLRDAGLRSGPVRIARYLDDLAHAAGGQRRPELIREMDQSEDEDLDFDSEVFKGYEASALTVDGDANAWDEYEEGDEELAAALGMDLDRLRLARTPIPGSLDSPLSSVPQTRASGAGAADRRARSESQPPAVAVVAVDAGAASAVTGAGDDDENDSDNDAEPDHSSAAATTTSSMRALSPKPKQVSGVTEDTAARHDDDGDGGGTPWWLVAVAGAAALGAAVYFLVT